MCPYFDIKTVGSALVIHGDSIKDEDQDYSHTALKIVLNLFSSFILRSNPAVDPA